MLKWIFAGAVLVAASLSAQVTKPARPPRPARPPLDKTLEAPPVPDRLPDRWEWDAKGLTVTDWADKDLAVWQDREWAQDARQFQRAAAAADREWERAAISADREIERAAIAADREWNADQRLWERQDKTLTLGPSQAAIADLKLHGALGEPGWARGSADDWRMPPGQWPEDPADSLYRQARELLNRGEWRQAVTTFRDITQKFPNSGYVPDALYWQAFALYRIGGGNDLRQALELLNTQRGKYPNARTQGDASVLATRIRGALAARGDATAAAQIARTAADSTQRCDQEDMAVRAEALNALAQSDPDGASQVLQRVLARRDECSASLRRNAIFILGGKRRDASTTATLIQVAKTDPSPEVRGTAIDWLARFSGDDALATLDELARTADDERIQRAAVRALVMNPGDKARQMVRGFIERNETPERLRLEALGAFEKDRVSADDITWLRTFYGRTDNPRVKQRILYTLGRVGGPEIDQWFLAMVKNPDESSETRTAALRRVGKSMAVADLAKLYDNSSERSVREELIGAFANRTEDEATDKLIDIVKTGTDPNLRRMAINALSRKKDARTMKFLLELVEK
ncbi:MAG: HEAT repeat domain-containing protein [Gemmatimonadaceae bacterium]